jgi:CPA2 family monovalent cation:H+ antiporter-2
VQSVGVKTVVIDNNLQTIQLMRRFGYQGFFGDPLRPDLLHAAGIDSASVLMVALDDPIAAERLITYARRLRPDIHIVARSRDRTHTYRLYQAGANDIVRELFDSSLRAGRYVLENVGLSDYEASEAEKLFYQHDRYTVRELADVWDPNIPSAQNEAYIARARELEKELEASLLSALENNDSDTA